MSVFCLLGLIPVLAVGFWGGRCWADRTTLPAWFPSWLAELLNWRRGSW